MKQELEDFKQGWSSFFLRVPANFRNDVVLRASIFSHFAAVVLGYDANDLTTTIFSAFCLG
jgi:hypothetical protein